MKAFRFRAARVLEWRRLRCDAARGELARANTAARETATSLAGAESSYDDAVAALGHTLRTTFDATGVQRHRTWMTHRGAARETCREAHKVRCDAVEAAADVLRLANRDVRIMERLRDRAWKRHVEAANKEEMKAFDELATLQYARKRTDSQGGTDRER